MNGVNGNLVNRNIVACGPMSARMNKLSLINFVCRRQKDSAAVSRMAPARLLVEIHSEIEAPESVLDIHLNTHMRSELRCGPHNRLSPRKPLRL
jgi:hypothetical protein